LVKILRELCEWSISDKVADVICAFVANVSDSFSGCEIRAVVVLFEFCFSYI